jgi:hypothetical protein
LLRYLDPIEKAKRALMRTADRKAKARSEERAPEPEDSSILRNSKDAESSNTFFSSNGVSSNAAKDIQAGSNSCAPQQSCVPGRTESTNLESFTKSAQARTRLTAKVSHEITLRHQAQCTHIMANGSRCRNRRWLHIHHIKEIANGGSHELENLTTLCSGHHRMLHNIH